MALSTQVPANDIGIKPYFATKNPCFTNPKMKTKNKLMLHSTATPGAPAQNFFPRWNASTAAACVEFVIDWDQILQYLPIGKNGKNCINSWHAGTGTSGQSANGTYIATEMCEPIQTQLIPINFTTQQQGGNTNRAYSIQRIQMELKALGYYTSNADGQFGANTTAAVKAYQKAKGLTVDGIVGKNTLKALQARVGSYAAYDVEAATPQFNAVYNNAVRLFAFLCGYCNCKPSEILCHSEGYKKGIATNHGDVMHWFPYHGKDMNAFRQDVADCIAGKYVALGQAVPDADKLYYANVDELVEAGIITSGDYWVDMKKNKVVNNSFVMALLRSSADYFCKTDAECAVAAVKAVKTDFDTGDYYCEAGCDKLKSGAVRELVVDLANIVDMADNFGYDDVDAAVDHMVELGMITSPELWKKGAAGEADVSKSGHAKYLVIAAARKLCSTNYVTSVDAIKAKIGMNSEAYWKGGEYNATNTVCLINAIASAL